MPKKELIASILKAVHSGFRYISDFDQYAEEDVWALPTKVGGDCEDFALACRKLVRAAGLESRLVICQIETGEVHCVLYVEDQYVMDNRWRYVPEMHQLPYVWLAASGLEAGDPWRAILSV